MADYASNENPQEGVRPPVLIKGRKRSSQPRIRDNFHKTTLDNSPGDLKSLVKRMGVVHAFKTSSDKQFVRQLMNVPKHERTLQHGLYAYENYLREVDFFQGFSASEVARIICACEMRISSPGRPFVTAGDVSDGMSVLYYKLQKQNGNHNVCAVR